MGDPRVHDFCNDLFGLAAGYIERVPMCRATVALGPRTVRILVPDIEMECGIDPLEGLVSVSDPPATADFDVVCIDARSGIPLPTGQWPSTWHAPVGSMADYRSEPFRLAIDRHSQTISVFHPGWCRGVIWMWDMSLLPYWAAATPWRLMLSWCADTFDAEFIHAACVYRDDRALLLVGPSGAGKSTTALLASEEGMGLVGDDFLLVHEGHAFPIYRRAKAHDSTLDLLDGAWTVLNEGIEGEKRILDIGAPVGRVPREGIRVFAACVPQVGEDGDLAPISSGEAFKRSAPYSLSGLFGGTRRSLTRTAALLEQLSTYTLPIRKDRQRDQKALASVWSA